MSGEPEEFALDLGLLGAQEQFLAEWRAGKRPRLSAYARRYPEYAGALAELVAALPPDMPASDAASVAAEPLAESFPERLWSGEGVTRAMEGIFGAASDERVELQVAEKRVEYQTPQGPDSPVTDTQRDEREND